MPRKKKMRRTKNQKRENSLDDDANVSHSESSTNKNNQSESWECPVSVKKNLIPNSRATFNHRRTLRSSTRLSDTGTASRRRSLKRHTSAPDDIQQLDDTSNTMNSAHQVSEGSECPVSAKKNLIPNSRTTFNRRCTLRSSTRLNETGASSLRRSSRRHSSAPVDIQQHDNTSKSKTINSAHQVSEGLDQVDLGHKEAENVENSTLAEPNMEEAGEAEPNMREEVGEAEQDTMEEAGETEPNNMMKEVGEAEPNMMEEVVEAEPNMMEEEGEGEAENSLSKHAEKKTFEKESIPLELESLAGGITNKNQRKGNSRLGCSSPFRSLELTEMVEMVGMEDDEEGEIQSQPEDPVKRYKVKEEFMPILIKIIGKYGDIAKNCVTESVEYRSWLLEMICGIISEFEKKDLSKIKEGVLKNKIDLVDGIKKMNVEVEWLLTRLIDAREARELLMQSGMLKEKTDQNKLIQESESALEKFEARKKELEEQMKAVCDGEAACKENLARAKNDSVTITRIVGFAKSKVQRFLHCSVVDGLI